MTPSKVSTDWRKKKGGSKKRRDHMVDVRASAEDKTQDDKMRKTPLNAKVAVDVTQTHSEDTSTFNGSTSKIATTQDDKISLSQKKTGAA